MKYPSAILLILSLCAGCSAPRAAITSSESQLLTRQVQTREYENISKKQAMRASLATLQDLSFILDRVDADLGTISASKYKGMVKVKSTVTVREKTPMDISVRISITYGEKAIEDPLIYQDFFSMLDKSLFLVKNQVD